MGEREAGPRDSVSTDVPLGRRPVPQRLIWSLGILKLKVPVQSSALCDSVGVIAYAGQDVLLIFKYIAVPTEYDMIILLSHSFRKCCRNTYWEGFSLFIADLTNGCAALSFTGSFNLQFIQSFFLFIIYLERAQFD
jgi:hypothetical protein